MLYFVSHKYQGDTANIDRVKRILHELQTKHTEHCFICPLLVFSHLEYGEIDFANLVGMEVVNLAEEFGQV